jgi:hypothetical protein
MNGHISNVWAGMQMDKKRPRGALIGNSKTALAGFQFTPVPATKVRADGADSFLPVGS